VAGLLWKTKSFSIAKQLARDVKVPRAAAVLIIPSLPLDHLGFQMRHHYAKLSLKEKKKEKRKEKKNKKRLNTLTL
jgi:hypothetical protein